MASRERLGKVWEGGDGRPWAEQSRTLLSSHHSVSPYPRAHERGLFPGTKLQKRISTFVEATAKCWPNLPIFFGFLLA